MDYWGYEIMPISPCLNCEILTPDTWGGYCHNCDNQLSEQEDN